MTNQTNIIQLCAHSRFAEVMPVGFKFNGASAGPDVLVAAPRHLAEAVFKKLLELPSLPWMHGSIRIIALEDADNSQYAAEPYDELLYLNCASDNELCDLTARRALRTTLRLCAKLGMISGRGLGDTRALADVA